MNGERVRRAGFTLIELLVVMSIIGLLLALSMPRYFNSLERSKEIALAENLKVLRVQIDQFYGDRGRYPETLEELVEAKYLRAVPVDPITDSSQTWQLDAPPEGPGVMDVHSGAEGSTRNGVPYGEI